MLYNKTLALNHIYYNQQYQTFCWVIGRAMNKKQPIITDKTRNAYLEAFCELYQKKSIEKISIQELTNKAGYNRSTFYQYFKDIYELLDYLEVFIMNRLQEPLKESINSDYTDFEFIDQIMRIHDEHYLYISALIGKHGNIHFASRLKDIAIPFILEAHKIPKDNVEARLVLEFHLSGVVAAVAYLHSNQKKIPSDDLKGLYHGICFEGSIRQFLKYK